MHHANEYVSYGTQGICQIEAIRSIQFEGCSDAREYYVLHPIAQAQSSIFVPVNNPRLTGRMRPVLSPEDIEQILSNIKGQRLAWIKDRKQRTELFNRILKAGGTSVAGSVSLPARPGGTQGAVLLGRPGSDNSRGHHRAGICLLPAARSPDRRRIYPRKAGHGIQPPALGGKRIPVFFPSPASSPHAVPSLPNSSTGSICVPPP